MGAEPWERAKLDQAMAELADTLPTMWWSLFDSCVKTGFSQDQAMRLVVEFIRCGIVTGGGEQ